LLANVNIPKMLRQKLIKVATDGVGFRLMLTLHRLATAFDDKAEFQEVDCSATKAVIRLRLPEHKNFRSTVCHITEAFKLG